jgi:hypothetical protein
VLARTGDDLVDVMRNGQAVLNIVVPLGPIVDELDTSIHELASAPGPDTSARESARRSHPAAAEGG